MPRASWDFIGNIRFSIPDLYTQKAIADFLDRETTRVDQLIEKKKRFLNLADERWRATLNHIIFPNSPDWKRLPSGWRKVRLKYLTDLNRPIMYGIVLPGPNMEEGPMIVKGGDVKPGRLRPDRLCRTTYEIEAGYARSRLKAGDLVISIRGGIGDIEIVPPEIDGANAVAQKELDNNFFKLRLWQMPDLLKALFRAYGELSDETRAKLPLKQIWAPISGGDA